jgi:ATP-dependent helicase/DNAse subunit B
MSTELIVAPPAAGKTTACIRRIQEQRKSNPLAKIWVVLPYGQQVIAFRRRLASAGGVMGTRVGTFNELYRAILEQAGIFTPAASAPLLHRIAQEVLDCAVEDGAIQYFLPLQRMPGFIQALRDVFSELKTAMVTPERFSETVSSGAAGRVEMAVLYSRYQARLKELNLADPEGISWLAAAALERQPQGLAPIDLLVVDGFDNFNGTQQNALLTLSRHVDNLLVTFTGEAGSSRTAHRRFTRDMETLTGSLDPRVTSLPDKPHLPGDIAWIEQRLFEVEQPAPRQAEGVLMLEARSQGEEVRETLRWIKKQVVRNHLRLADCAVFIPDTAVYQPLIRMTAAEFGIAVRFSRSEPIHNSPAVTALLNLAMLPLQDFNTFYMLNALRSPYFDLGMEAQTVDALETIARVTRVIEGRAQWLETWNLLGRVRLENQDDMDEDRALKALPRGDEALALQSALEAVFDRLEPPTGEQTQTEWISWLENLLDAVKFYSRAENERDRADCEVFSGLLKAVVVSEAIAGERQVSYADFMLGLQSMLEGVSQREVETFGSGALTVCPMVEARGVRYKAVALLGLSEGSFPVNEHPDPFLDEELRASLGLESRLQREQAGLFYQAVTRSDKYLLITRPYLSDDGEKWEESAYWKAVRLLFDKNAVQTVKPEALQPLADAASSQELLFTAVRAKDLPKKYAVFNERWEQLSRARNVIQARRAKKAVGPYEGAVGAALPLSGRDGLFPTNTVWSSSRLEAYSCCPLNFYVSHALKLEPRELPEPGLDVAQKGSIVHKILELTFKAQVESGNKAGLRADFDKACREVFEKAPLTFGFRPSPLWDFEKEQLKAKLLETVETLAGEGEWTPEALEVKYGMDGLPPLKIDLDGESIFARGVIDRVDVNNAGEYRVVDYKTGSAHMAPLDLYNGRKLQLPIYALAVRDALGLGEVVEGFYWRVLAAEPSSLKLSKFKAGDAAGTDVAVSVLKNHLGRIVHGIRAGNFSPAAPRGGCPAYCPCSVWCWRCDPEW